MSRETGRIIAVQDGWADVETLRQSACQSCTVKNTCGHNVLERTLGRKTHRVRARLDLDVRPQDVVELESDDAVVAQAALWIYLFPLLCVAVSLAVLGSLGVSEVGLILAAGASLGAAFLVLRYRHATGLTAAHTPRVVALVEPHRAPECLQED